MLTGDLPRILEIERASHALPWDEGDFTRVLLGADGRVVGVRGVIVGFVVFRVEPGEAILLNMAIAPAWRCLGIGRAVVAELQEFARAKPGRGIAALVAERNVVAQLFFRAVGFCCVRIVRDGSGDDDAYQFAWSAEKTPWANRIARMVFGGKQTDGTTEARRHGEKP
jgi:ribosomal protein S18 acetylase RimI-like enzyme